MFIGGLPVVCRRKVMTLYVHLKKIVYCMSLGEKYHSYFVHNLEKSQHFIYIGDRFTLYVDLRETAHCV